MAFSNNTLNLRFKLIALAPQISVEDERGAVQLYVRQKLLKLRESVTVFSDDTQREKRYEIQADRVIDFRARYTITSAAGQVIGALKQRGMKSLWRVHFDVEDRDGNVVFSIVEQNPWVRLVDSLIGSIPIIGLLSGYVFQPAYVFRNSAEATVGMAKKQPALFEGLFTLSFEPSASEDTRELLTLSALMMILLERARG
ncbi:MAG: hypothetical protein EAZ43_15945 [Betaproteobacteria bacterium]|nr:MAG: hypothetical protein EAZ43_15945 [Betaproteobacteria bacterium]